MAHPLENWFEWLSETHQRTLTLNNQTDSDIVVFATDQSPKSLLPTQQVQRNLSQHLSNHFGIAPPDEAFSTGSFRDFVDAIVPDRDTDVRNVFYLVAVRNDVTIGQLTQPQFGRKKSKDMFTKKASRDDLFRTLDGFTPDEFFPGTPANRTKLETLITGEGTVDAACKKVLG